MPIFLILAGIVLLVSAVKGTTNDLFEVLKDDFTGSGNYFVWVVAIAVIVAVGNVEKLRPVSNAFLALVIVVIFLANRGLIPSFFEQIREGTGASGGSVNLRQSIPSGNILQSSFDTLLKGLQR